MTLLVSDLSSLGFSIITDKSNDIFPVGIVLPDLELRFAGTHLLACKAQVVYRQPLKSDSGNYRCGLTIIDIGLSSQTGWSLAHMSNVYARLGEGQDALRCLSLLSRFMVMNNFFTTHNDWRNAGARNFAPYQIDANFGWTAAVQEMLLFSVPGTISVIPALPQQWTTGSVTRLLARGGVQVSIAWDQDKQSAPFG